MAKGGMNLQDSFLNQVRKDNTEIKVVMLDGVTLTGHVRGFDNFTVILHAQGLQHLIYKHAIAQIIQRRQQHEGDRPARDTRPPRQENQPKRENAEQQKPKDKFNSLNLNELKPEETTPKPEEKLEKAEEKIEKTEEKA